MRRRKAVYDTYAYRANDAEKIADTRNNGRDSGNCLSSGQPSGREIPGRPVALKRLSIQNPANRERFLEVRDSRNGACETTLAQQ
jgi:hypothetical protein